MNRRPSIHSNTGLKYYLILTNVEDHRDIEDQVKYVGGDNLEYITKQSKKMWGDKCIVENDHPTCNRDQDLDEIFLDE